MLSGVLSSSHSTGSRLFLRIRLTCNVWVPPPARSFADKGGGKGDLSNNINAAAPSCWKSDQGALKISSVSEMYPTAVICLFWTRDFFWVARRFWLPRHISKKSRTLAILCNVFSSTSFYISESLSEFIVSNWGSAPAKIWLWARANCLGTTFSQRVWPVDSDCLQQSTSRPREGLPSTPTRGGMIENISRVTLKRLAYFECVSNCWCHHSVISGNQNVLLTSIGSKWKSLRFELICPQFFGVSGGEFKYSLAAVNQRAAWSLHLGVISATSLGVQYSSSSLDKSYGSKDDWKDAESAAEGMRLPLCRLSG